MEKERTLSQLHSLWLETQRRFDYHQAKICAMVDRIEKEVTPDEKGYRIVYYYHDSVIQCYRFMKSSYGRGLSYSVGNRTPENNRHTKIAQTVGGPELDLGTEFHRLVEYRDNLDGKIHHVFWKKLQDMLTETFRGRDKAGTYCFNVTIDGYVYLIQAESTSYGYTKFNFFGAQTQPNFTLETFKGAESLVADGKDS